MKQLFVFFLFSSSFTVKAQSNAIDLQKFIETSPRLKQQSTTAIASRKDISWKPCTRTIIALNSKPGVYRLPKDGMPCIVPDTKDITAIPNTYKGIISVPFAGNTPRIPTQPFKHSAIKLNLASPPIKNKSQGQPPLAL